MFKEFLKDHAFEFKIMAIGIAISFVIGLALTGDFSEALARSKR